MINLQGYCPMGCGATLFVADGGHITCSYASCPDPSAVDTVLGDRETEHLVQFTGSDFLIRHPLRERRADHLVSCDLNERLAVLDGPPVPQDCWYRASQESSGMWHLRPVLGGADHG